MHPSPHPPAIGPQSLVASVPPLQSVTPPSTPQAFQLYPYVPVSKSVHSSHSKPEEAI
ncbi:hypothetical protein BD310DRAFT_936732 [Dichomitus squalens]|uniref:Uncharacterized protein n=1 Tax=Dichomitus squalens TaxID=114155 RepID=A0A4Q9PJ68_9APHY|nr:hypothetical protein BD310DRAFT_936732 [Dichomitus squalens]